MNTPNRNTPWLPFVAVALLTTIAGCKESTSAEQGRDDSVNNVEGTFYADTGWNGTHSGPRNDDVARIDLPRGFRHAWNGAENNAFLQGQSIAFDKESFLVVTGYGPGKSNLVAYDLEGDVLWQTPPWEDGEGFDSCASISAAVIDLDGDIYVGDCNQLWAFHTDGRVKWVVDLPLAPDASPSEVQDITAGPVNPITQAWFTKEGAVGGITLYGDVFIVSREKGELLYEPFRLPGKIQNELAELPLGGGAYEGTLDPELQKIVWNWLFATEAFISADTPAVSSRTGRLFVSAKSSTSGNSMYAIDPAPGTGGNLGTVSIAWESPLDETGGSSPALPPDESFVAAGTGEGNIRAFDVNTGDELWFYFDTQAAAGSVAIGPESRVFSIPSTGTAINTDGSLLWATTDQLDVLLDGVPPSDTLGPPVVASSSILLVIGDKILQYVTVGYDLSAVFPTPFLVPVKGFLVTRDRTTGELVKGSIPFEGRTSLENLPTPHKSGRVAISYGALLSSIMLGLEDQINPFLPPGVSLMPNDPGMQVVEGIDEATIGDSVDGVIDDDGEGDFMVDLDTGATGSAKIGTATVTIDVQAVDERFEGELTINDSDRGIQGTLEINDASIDTGLGPHAAGGMATGALTTPEGEIQVQIPWLVKDWS